MYAQHLPVSRRWASRFTNRVNIKPFFAHDHVKWLATTAPTGLLASFSFTLLFSTCSLIAGRAVDVVSRKTATVASCLVWSAMAAGTSLANSFPTVFGLRVLQGSAQAFTVGGFSVPVAPRAHNFRAWLCARYLNGMGPSLCYTDDVEKAVLAEQVTWAKVTCVSSVELREWGYAGQRRDSYAAEALSSESSRQEPFSSRSDRL